MEAASVGGLHAQLLGQILQYIIPGELHSILHFRLRSRKRSFNAQVFPCGCAVVGFWRSALSYSRLDAFVATSRPIDQNFLLHLQQPKSLHVGTGGCIAGAATH